MIICDYNLERDWNGHREGAGLNSLVLIRAAVKNVCQVRVWCVCVSTDSFVA